MIYASLRAVPRWNSWTVPVLFLLYALAGGALLNALPITAVVLLVALGLFQVFHYLTGDQAFLRSGTTLANGDGARGRRSFDAARPHPPVRAAAHGRQLPACARWCFASAAGTARGCG